ncbi:MAG: hypothetical protein HQL28_05240 [Candidatus Omnitrophica bacterium]|nr:hypothetical protein [Candidatus Omnitrophota bacterium]
MRLRESAKFGVTIFEHDPKSTAALDFYNLTSEIVNLENRFLDTMLREFSLFAPEAGDVYVLGDFNGWKKCDANKLVKIDDGKWQAHFNIKKGRYRYKFMVDGKWTHDTSNDLVEENVFGSVDSVLSL